MGKPRMRPGQLTFIAWVWIVLGVALALSGGLGTHGHASVERGPIGGPVFDFLSEHFALLQTLPAVVIAIGGIALLRLRRWGALVVAGAACVGLAYAILLIAVLLHELGGFGTIPSEALGVLPFLAAGVALSAVFWGTPLVLALYVLIRPGVRQALR